jgi:hypothetical protein
LKSPSLSIGDHHRIGISTDQRGVYYIVDVNTRH